MRKSFLLIAWVICTLATSFLVASSWKNPFWQGILFSALFYGPVIAFVWSAILRPFINFIGDVVLLSIFLYGYCKEPSG